MNANGNNHGRRDLALAGGLFVAGWLLRLAHLATVRDAPFFSLLILDPLYYDRWAQRIASGDWLGDGAFWQDPLYPYLLGAVYAVVGHRLVLVVLLQGLLGATIAPLLFLAARRSLGRSAAVVAGVLAAGYLPAIYYEGLILKTWLATWLVALWLWCAERAREHAAPGPWLGAGLLLGLAVLARGNLLLIVPVFAAWALVERRRLSRPGPGTREAWVPVAAALAGALLVVGLTTVRNRVVGGEWVLTTVNAGQNFYIGNNPHNTDGEYARLPFVEPSPQREQADFAREAARRTGWPLSPAETSRFWFGEARDWIVAHPDAWLRLSWLKLRAFWSAFEIPDNLDYYLYRQHAPVLRLPLFGFGLVAPLGLLGALLLLRRGGWPRLCVLFVVVYPTAVVLFFVFSRFRMALLPPLLVLAGHGAVELWHRVRAVHANGAEAGWPLARAVAALVALLLFVNVPVRGPADGLLLRAAQRMGLPTRVESSAAAHFNLGVAWAAEAKQSADAPELLALAESELQRALEGGADFAPVWIELGKVRARRDRNVEALEAYTRALELEPSQLHAIHATGLLQRRLGRPEQAAAAFRRALALEPRYVLSAVALGEVLLELGDPVGAEAAFQRALEIDPSNRAAARGLTALR